MHPQSKGSDDAENQVKRPVTPTGGGLRSPSLP